MEFAPGDEALDFFCGGIQGFRWSDWTGSGTTDYDLVFTDARSGATVATSIGDQTAGAQPLEVPVAIDCVAHPVLKLWVNLFSAGAGTSGDVLEFMVNRTAFQYSSNPYSASGPVGDSSNSGLVAVGAIDPPEGSVIASYSSQGPTNDDRIKPDISAPSCLPSFSYSPFCFNGTSAATPVAAGAAALVFGSGLETNPGSISTYLQQNAIDLGAPGLDPVFGAGRLTLGTPPVSNTPPVNTILPAVVGTANVGQQLTATSGTWTGTDPITYTHQWQRCNGACSDIASQTASIYTVVSGDIGSSLRVVVTATNVAGSDSAESTGTVIVPPPPNQPPTVSAGPDQNIALPMAANLPGTVDDDGLPFDTLTSIWTMVSGPGSVQFDNPTSPRTTARFSTDGWFVLRLTAFDGAASTTDHVSVVVAPPVDSFSDDDDSVFEADIEWMAAEGITKGCNPPTNDRFCPDSLVTRGQMAAFLVRALNLTLRLDNPFTDDDDSVFEADIERLAAAGITKGCNPPVNTLFCPDAKVTREQMAAFLVRALMYTDNGGGDLFIDDDDSIFENDIDKLATAGVTKGCNPSEGNTKFCPREFVTRGQMAAFLHRALG